MDLVHLDSVMKVIAERDQRTVGMLVIVVLPPDEADLVGRFLVQQGHRSVTRAFGVDFTGENGVGATLDDALQAFYDAVVRTEDSKVVAATEAKTKMADAMAAFDPNAKP